MSIDQFKLMEEHQKKMKEKAQIEKRAMKKGGKVVSMNIALYILIPLAILSSISLALLLKGKFPQGNNYILASTPVAYSNIKSSPSASSTPLPKPTSTPITTSRVNPVKAPTPIVVTQTTPTPTCSMYLSQTPDTVTVYQPVTLYALPSTNGQLQWSGDGIFNNFYSNNVSWYSSSAGTFTVTATSLFPLCSKSATITVNCDSTKQAMALSNENYNYQTTVNSENSRYEQQQHQIEQSGANCNFGSPNAFQSSCGGGSEELQQAKQAHEQILANYLNIHQQDLITIQNKCFTFKD